jgi:hypothetical protein
MNKKCSPVSVAGVSMIPLTRKPEKTIKEIAIAEKW